MKIYFDMDGTVANLYAVEGWLDYLRAYDSTPYRKAEPMGDLEKISELLNKLQNEKGYEIGVISWLSKESNRNYDSKVRSAKYNWLHRYMRVEFDEVHIVKYGTNKNNYCEDEYDILFDDEVANRENWGGQAFEPKDIISVLEGLM